MPVEPRAAIAQTLRASRRVLIVCHAAPDGDCLGSGLALADALGRLGVEVTVGSADGVPASLAFLPGADRVVTAVPDDAAYDAVVTMECSTPARAGALEPALRRGRTLLAIDHHGDHVPYADITDLDPRAAAVGEQVADLIGRLGVVVDARLATNLLTALVTDTGVFRYPNTTPAALRLAADLMERGGSIPAIVRAVYDDQPAAAVRLRGLAVAGLALHHDGRIATTVITPAMLEAAGARPEDASGIAATLRTIAGVRLAMVFEPHDGGVRISIRSRDGVRSDRVAQALGGGGHPAAAGADVPGGLEDVMPRALALAAREVNGVDAPSA